MSRSVFEKRIQVLKEFQNRLQALQATLGNKNDIVDAQLLGSQIQAELLELGTVQSWKTNPMIYVVLPGASVDSLMKRNFAPPVERLKSVIARLRRIPAVLQAMQENVENPPKAFTDLAIRMAGGSVGFFRTTVPQWARQAAQGDRVLLLEFETANKLAVQSMETSLNWLKTTLLAKSQGNYAIGRETFAKKLLYEEMVSLPLEKVLAIGEANLEKDYQDFVATAKLINTRRSPADVMKSISDDHPSEQTLLDSTGRTIEGIHQFLIDKRIITIPSEVRPIITETPVYDRSGSFASMDTPGPYEDRATEAYYYVTPPESSWDAKHKEQHLRLYNSSVMKMITIHEVYPGHYVQFLYAKQFPTKTRKLLGCGTNVEGWAHYSEQMMLEEGYGTDDPKIRLAQLAEALLRDCRYVVGIRLHTRGMTVEEGTRVFVEKGFQEPANAFEEARRGAYNPTYLYYTLGKLEILRLREDYRKARGQAYSLQGFHDEFIKLGPLPFKLVRRILLPGNSEPESIFDNPALIR
jgi:uncharacterized protein (DUF885 family)